MKAFSEASFGPGQYVSDRGGGAEILLARMGSTHQLKEAYSRRTFFAGPDRRSGAASERRAFKRARGRKLTMTAAMLLTVFLVCPPCLPDLISRAAAEPDEFRRISVAIQDRETDPADGVIRLAQGEIVDIVFTSDEAVELHLHGYDLTVILEPGIPRGLRLDAKIAGRFAIEAHRASHDNDAGERAGSGHAPLLYLEVYPE